MVVLWRPGRGVRGLLAAMMSGTWRGSWDRRCVRTLIDADAAWLLRRGVAGAAWRVAGWATATAGGSELATGRARCRAGTLQAWSGCRQIADELAHRGCMTRTIAARLAPAAHAASTPCAGDHRCGASRCGAWSTRSPGWRRCRKDAVGRGRCGRRRAYSLRSGRRSVREWAAQEPRTGMPGRRSRISVQIEGCVPGRGRRCGRRHRDDCSQLAATSGPGGCRAGICAVHLRIRVRRLAQFPRRGPGRSPAGSTIIAASVIRIAYAGPAVTPQRSRERCAWALAEGNPLTGARQQAPHLRPWSSGSARLRRPAAVLPRTGLEMHGVHYRPRPSEWSEIDAAGLPTSALHRRARPLRRGQGCRGRPRRQFTTLATRPARSPHVLR